MQVAAVLHASPYRGIKLLKSTQNKHAPFRIRGFVHLSVLLCQSRQEEYEMSLQNTRVLPLLNYLLFQATNSRVASFPLLKVNSTRCNLWVQFIKRHLHICDLLAEMAPILTIHIAYTIAAINLLLSTVRRQDLQWNWHNYIDLET